MRNSLFAMDGAVGLTRFPVITTPASACLLASHHVTFASLATLPRFPVPLSSPHQHGRYASAPDHPRAGPVPLDTAGHANTSVVYKTARSQCDHRRFMDPSLVDHIPFSTLRYAFGRCKPLSNSIIHQSITIMLIRSIHALKGNPALHGLPCSRHSTLSLDILNMLRHKHQLRGRSTSDWITGISTF